MVVHVDKNHILFTRVEPPPRDVLCHWITMRIHGIHMWALRGRLHKCGDSMKSHNSTALEKKGRLNEAVFKRIPTKNMLDPLKTV